MKKVRYNVFETNSSSMHSIIIGNLNLNLNIKNENVFRCFIDNEGILEIPLGKFGWGVDWYTDPYTKLQYALTMVYETETPYINNRGKNESAFYETSGYNEILDLLRSKCNVQHINIRSFDGYIDHQSREDYHSLDDFLNEYDVILEDFIFNPNVILKIDNDNH